MGLENWPVGQQVNPLASGMTYLPSPTHWPKNLDLLANRLTRWPTPYNWRVGYNTCTGFIPWVRIICRWIEKGMKTHIIWGQISSKELVTGNCARCFLPIADRTIRLGIEVLDEAVEKPIFNPSSEDENNIIFPLYTSPSPSLLSRQNIRKNAFPHLRSLLSRGKISTYLPHIPQLIFFPQLP